MNHYEARYRESGGWAWTVMEDGVIRTAGGCINGPHAHETREEAERCYWEWELAEAARHLHRLDLARAFERLRCQVPGCRRWEAYRATGWHLVRDVSLCSVHGRDPRASLAAAHPFQPGLRFISSW